MSRRVKVARVEGGRGRVDGASRRVGVAWCVVAWWLVVVVVWGRSSARGSWGRWWRWCASVVSRG